MEEADMKARKQTRLFSVLALLLTLCTLAQSQQKWSATADNKYGEGGKVETYSNEKSIVIYQTWLDPKGDIREVYDNPNPSKQTWTFYGPGTKLTTDDHDLEITYNPKTKHFSVDKPRTEIDNVEPAQVREWIGKVEERFAKTGTSKFTMPWQKVDGTIEQPNLPSAAASNKPKTEQPSIDPDRPDPLPADVFNPPKNTSSEPKKEEPKKEEPKKEEPPKTDKTSTGKTGGNTASTTPFTAPGYAVEVKKEFDLVRLFITTPEGGITENIPADIQPGESFSGSSYFDPKGKDAAERLKNLNALKEYEFKLGGQPVELQKALPDDHPNLKIYHVVGLDAPFRELVSELYSMDQAVYRQALDEVAGLSLNSIREQQSLSSPTTSPGCSTAKSWILIPPT
jgi:hypothetical protein